MLGFLIVLVLLVVLLAVWIISAYNRLTAASVRVDNSWSQIDVQLKKRYDLIPNLVKTVKGYANFEQSTLEKVINLRNAATGAKSVGEKIANNNELTKSINNILFTVENYPDLKANSNFLNLQAELKEIETKIAMSRQFYNDTVMKYNEKIVKFPTNLIAAKLGYNQRPYYAAEEEVEKTPDIQF